MPTGVLLALSTLANTSGDVVVVVTTGAVVSVLVGLDASVVVAIDDEDEVSLVELVVSVVVSVLDAVVVVVVVVVATGHGPNTNRVPWKVSVLSTPLPVTPLPRLKPTCDTVACG